MLHIKQQVIDSNYGVLGMYLKRWIMMYEFIMEHPEIEKVALMDIDETEVLQNFFKLIEDDKLYVGDELFDLSKNNVAKDPNLDFIKEFLMDNERLQLLNPGLIAGSRRMILGILSIYIFLVDRTIADGTQNQFENYEMNIFNYIIYKYFDESNRLKRNVKQHDELFSMS
ncbi:hypothetical protein G7084_05235 [Weissella coleopterorum]|uniref:Uncharacterized protein n=1 Tax=Weissella coleopterorum TaxID=2714949 RepID=A0A6G8B0I5_9LACO|nr:hypothetical protein [Weissella coleopterorum]QIL50766.1 hypothetical protein G7084_05235 [Weissella coleopterorum]